MPPKVANAIAIRYVAAAVDATTTALPVPSPRDIFVAFTNRTKAHAMKEAVKAF